MRILVALALCAFPFQSFAREIEPIIDVHMHALAADEQGPPPMGMCTPIVIFPAWDPAKPYPDLFIERFKHPPCKDPVWSPMTNEALMNETITVMNRLNIVGVVSGTPQRVATWRAAAPGRFIPGLEFQIGPNQEPLDKVRELFASGQMAVLGEVTNQYAGVAPDDPRMEPYWALAEALDIPVGIHVGPGPPGVIYMGASDYRARLHSALTMEEVLVRHPRLRVYIMHAGFPMIDDMLAVLYAHPQVYVDVGVIVFTQPRAVFYRYLQAMVESGFGNRVMFGSDQMVWPGVIERSVKVINDAPFLSAAQKRDILYNNAAHFLRLTPADMAAHRKMGASLVK